ncbi:hypothetical protein cypCar_00018576 [Cyprinus carpio]|nr:hypothetical protein cypCar_00018576 [Cyprinus carpio]
MNKLILIFVELCIIYQSLGDFTEGSASSYHDTNEVVHEDEIYYTPQLDYKHPQWCHVFKLSNGEVSCSSPRGGHHRGSLGTRCLLSCDRGYKRLGQASVQCMPNRRWSGSAVCRKIRCHVLPLIDHGMYSCTRGFVVDSRCDYNCYEGYQIEGDRYRMCQEEGTWSGTEPTCAVRRCPKLKPPMHGYLMCSSDGNNYGAVCEYHCDPGFERTGFATRVCQLNRNWSDEAARCVLMDIKTDVRSAGALLDQFYEKRRLLVVSTPENANQKYRLQNIMLQKAECGLDLRHVTVIELLGTPPRAVGRIKQQQLEPEVIEGLRQALHISTAYFTMVLLDEYGVDRERFVNPTTSDELYSYVDEYLLTEEELERLAMNRDFCD